MSVSKVTVKLHKQTTFEGRALRPSDVIDVDPSVAERWARFGIAEVVQGISQTPKPAKVSQPQKASVAFEDVPHADLLRENGVEDVASIPQTLSELVDFDGIGTAKARDILEALNDAHNPN